mmetsp:Transcript_7765/g.15996  ORF Transcript_7765/g.15996 Transcript_7765/m.15996 type:complete len:210 (+) Transcript_7765:1199-1828(+)
MVRNPRWSPQHPPALRRRVARSPPVCLPPKQVRRRWKDPRGLLPRRPLRHQPRTQRKRSGCSLRPSVLRNRLSRKVPRTTRRTTSHLRPRPQEVLQTGPQKQHQRTCLRTIRRHLLRQGCPRMNPRRFRSTMARVNRRHLPRQEAKRTIPPKHRRTFRPAFQRHHPRREVPRTAPPTIQRRFRRLPFLHRHQPPCGRLGLPPRVPPVNR